MPLDGVQESTALRHGLPATARHLERATGLERVRAESSFQFARFPRPIFR